MGLKFTCKKCGKTGFAACSGELPFLHCSWYRDYKGLVHGCLYCRACGIVYDTVGSLLAPIKMILGKMPSTIIATYQFSDLVKLTKMNNPDFPNLRSMNPYVLMAMEEDGRFKESEDITEDSTLDFLLECLSDDNFIVRRESIIALRRTEDKRAIEPLIRALKDKHWEVRRNAAIALGEIGDTRAIEALNQLLLNEKWEAYVRKEALIALEKVKSKSTGNG